jgi:CRP/FNR family cyclic AMP-dependent transcriptional regulator
MVSVEVLNKVDLFKGLNNEELEKVARICREHTFEDGQLCVSEGGKAEDLYILQKGKVAIELEIRYSGRRVKAAIATLGPGRVFGWSALVEPHVLTASVSCEEKAEIIAIKGADLLDLFQKDNHIGYVVMKNLAAVIGLRLTRTRQRLAIELERAAAGER